jgi:hypothetical protein
MVTDESGEDFNSLSNTELISAKDKAVSLARDFADPSKVLYPQEFLKLYIKEVLRKSSI